MSQLILPILLIAVTGIIAEKLPDKYEILRLVIIIAGVMGIILFLIELHDVVFYKANI